MWQCPKCGTEVDDSLKLCWICGTSPDGTEYRSYASTADSRQKVRLAVETFNRRKLAFVAEPGDLVDAGVPRRFGLDKLMIITAFYAVLFALMSWLGAHPIVFVVVAMFFTGVGLAQAFLYSGNKPRKASIVAGSVLCASIPVATMVAGLWLGRGNFDIFMFIARYAVLAAVLALVGGLLGYVTGCLIASIFLGKRSSLPEADDLRSETPDPLSFEDTQNGLPEHPREE